MPDYDSTNAAKVAGGVAHDAVDAGAPVKVGGYGSLSAPAAVADGDRVNLWLGRNGQNYTVLTSTTGGASADIGGDGDTEAFPPSLAVRAMNKVKDPSTGFAVSVRGDANGMAVQPAPASTFWQYAAAAGGIVSSTADVALKAAGAAGVRNFLSSLTIQHDVLSAVTEFVIKDGATIIYRGKLQTPDNEVGVIINFPVPLRGTAATAMNFALLSSVTGGVFVNAQGYTGS